MYILIARASIPMMDKRSAEKEMDFQIIAKIRHPYYLIFLKQNETEFFIFFSILLSCLHLNAKELVDLIESDIQEVMTNVIEWRHHFHEYPELSNREFETAKYIKSKLEDMGLNVETGIAHTGLIAMIRGQKEGPLMALRADMDALPVEEKLNLPFSSKVRTVYQGQDVGVMHACGHDAHMVQFY